MKNNQNLFKKELFKRGIFLFVLLIFSIIVTFFFDIPSFQEGYTLDNLDVEYHNKIEANLEKSGLTISPVYYKPGSYKYGGPAYVPSYSDSIYLSNSLNFLQESPYVIG
jgi:hypothetical protein